MSDRHVGYIVVLEHEVHEEHSADLITALKQIKGVIEVTPVVNDFTKVMAKSQARRELILQLYEVLKE